MSAPSSRQVQKIPPPLLSKNCCFPKGRRCQDYQKTGDWSKNITHRFKFTRIRAKHKKKAALQILESRFLLV